MIVRVQNNNGVDIGDGVSVLDGSGSSVQLNAGDSLIFSSRDGSDINLMDLTFLSSTDATVTFHNGIDDTSVSVRSHRSLTTTNSK